MKKVDKKLLDELIEMHRGVNAMRGADGAEVRDQYGKCFDKANELQAQCGMFSGSADNLLSGILMWYGLAPEATNEDIYKILEILGWEVLDEERKKADEESGEADQG